MKRIVVCADGTWNYRGGFNSELDESMDLKYRLLGEYRRQIGIAPDSNENVHRSALDRLAHRDSRYGPENLKKCQRTTPPTEIIGTSGAPC